jgi:salicylate hydroxylase
MTREVIVVGGGLAGLAAALALTRAGLRVQVLEQAQEFGEIGAGITVSPNASRVFRHLGLLEELRALATVVSIQGVVYYETGAVLGTKDRSASAAGDNAAPFLQLLRADLHRLILRALLSQAPDCVRLQSTVVDVEQGAGRVSAVCQDGSRFEADALIGADGIRSRVRAALFGADAPRFTGRVAWRGLIPVADLPDIALPFPSGAAVGPARTFGWYLVRNGTLVNYVAIVGTDEYRGEGWRTASSRDEVRRHFVGGIDLIGRLIDATAPSSCFKWALFDRPAQAEWVRDRVALLGDAAHPMLPYMGQGAAMGFEDAVILARCLQSHANVGDALQCYQHTRQPRANLVHLGSAAKGEMWEARGVARGLGRELVDEERELFPYDAATAPLMPPATRVA